MNRKQTNRKEMQDSVVNYLDQNVSKWSSIPKFADAKNELTSFNEQINGAHSAQNASKVRIGSTKKELKSVIATKADILNDIVEAYASINNMPELENRMAFSANSFVKMRNEDFIIGVKEVIDETEKIQPVLTAEYGLTVEQVEDIKIDYNRFLELKDLPRGYKVASRVATTELEVLFDQASNVLSEQLDKLMKLFKRRDPNFYNGYIAARVIVDD